MHFCNHCVRSETYLLFQNALTEDFKRLSGNPLAWQLDNIEQQGQAL